jgi:hypothetical protein
MSDLRERVQRALVSVAYIVATHGPQYGPILARLEREEADLQANDPIARARRILERHTIEGQAQRVIR